jgi:hypothetical protein
MAATLRSREMNENETADLKFVASSFRASLNGRYFRCLSIPNKYPYNLSTHPQRRRAGKEREGWTPCASIENKRTVRGKKRRSKNERKQGRYFSYVSHFSLPNVLLETTKGCTTCPGRSLAERLLCASEHCTLYIRATRMWNLLGSN